MNAEARAKYNQKLALHGLPASVPTWRERAKEAITEACLAWADHRGEIPRQAMPDKDEFFNYVRKHYPFGERAMWPYKIWLSEMKHLKEQLYGTPQKPIEEEGNLFA